MKADMTSRERVRCVLEGRRPDRVPFNFWMDRDAMAKYDERWGHDFRVHRFDVDVIEAFVGLPWWAGLQARTVQDAKTTWQVEPLADSLEQALKLDLPDPAAPGLCQDLIAKRAAYPDKAIFALMLAPLDVLGPLRLAENLCLDLYDRPDVVHAMLDRIKPILIEAARNACRADIDVLYLAGDLCSRDGPMYSLSHLREFVFDYLIEVIDIAHAAGKKVFYHTDGRVLPIVSLFIEYGFDGINPLEPRLNDASDFVSAAGGKLMLYGGLDNCRAIPDGTPQTVRRHVEQQYQALRQLRGLIFSTHDIPAHCPLENLEVMVDAIKHCGA